MRRIQLISILIASAFMFNPSSFAKDSADSNNAFGFKMLSALKKDSRAANLFISPLSISQVMKMAMNGAAGKTLQQMGSVLQLDSNDLATVNKQDQQLLAAITTPNASFVQMYKENGSGDPTLKLKIANSLWGNKNIQFAPEFTKACNTSYGAEVRSVDFGKPQTVTDINNWTSKQTAGKIPTIVQKLRETDLLVLINATYFKAPWEDKFQKEETKPLPFHAIDGTSPKVPMMHRKARLGYQINDNFQAVRLPYADRDNAMYVLLPKEGKTVDSVLSGLNDASYKALSQKFDQKLGDLYLPKFKFDYSKKLNDGLTKLGMIDAFSAKDADFSKMIKSGPRPFVSSVIHKSYVDVNEEGTEAAAVTAMMMAGSGMPRPEQPFSMKVDRPFLFIIANETTNSVLFMGTVGDPTKASFED